jgi:hypothetical protein
MLGTPTATVVHMVTVATDQHRPVAIVKQGRVATVPICSSVCIAIYMIIA